MTEPMHVRGTVSVDCLPALIAELDAKRYRPTPEQRDEIIARYQAIELSSRPEPLATIAANMINVYLIDVIRRTRKYRLPENKGRRWQR